MAEFNGFGREFFDFFRELKSKNDRAWFEANKSRFREAVQAPMSDFIAAMAPHLARVSKEFIADPEAARRLDVPDPPRCALLERQTSVQGACRVSVPAPLGARRPRAGVLRASCAERGVHRRRTLDARSERAAENTERHRGETRRVEENRCRRRFRGDFGSVEGDQLRRPPRGFDPSHPLIDDIRRKSFVVGRNSSEREARSARFLADTAKSFAAAAPFMRFLCGALAVPF